MGKDSPRVSRLSRLISDMASRQGWSPRLARARAWKIWEEVVGAEIGAHSWPSRIIRGEVLEVAVSDSVWMQQISFHKAFIVQELNSRLRRDAALKDIRLVLGNPGETCFGSKKIGSHVRHENMKIDRGEWERAKDLFASVKDDELRGALVRLYLKSRMRQKRD